MIGVRTDCCAAGDTRESRSKDEISSASLLRWERFDIAYFPVGATAFGGAERSILEVAAVRKAAGRRVIVCYEVALDVTDFGTWFNSRSYGNLECGARRCARLVGTMRAMPEPFLTLPRGRCLGFVPRLRLWASPDCIGVRIGRASSDNWRSLSRGASARQPTVSSVLPSANAGPNVILDAIACRAAVFATRIGRIPEIVGHSSEAPLTNERSDQLLSEPPATLRQESPRGSMRCGARGRAQRDASSACSDRP